MEPGVSAPDERRSPAGWTLGALGLLALFVAGLAKAPCRLIKPPRVADAVASRALGAFRSQV